VSEHGIGVATEFRCDPGAPPETRTPRQAEQNTGAVRVPKTALPKIIAVDEVARGSERRRRDPACSNSAAVQWTIWARNGVVRSESVLTGLKRQAGTYVGRIFAGALLQ
jgi:hypothetical protein